MVFQHSYSQKMIKLYVPNWLQSLIAMIGIAMSPRIKGPINIYPRLHNKMQRVLAARRAVLVYTNIIGIALLSLILLFFTSPVHAATALSQCPDPTNRINSILTTGTGAWSYYVGGEDAFLGKCILQVVKTKVISGNAQEFRKHDQPGNDNDYNNVEFHFAGASIYTFTTTGSDLIAYNVAGSNAKPFHAVYETPDIRLGTSYSSNMDLLAASYESPTYWGGTGYAAQSSLLLEGLGYNPSNPPWPVTSITLSNESPTTAGSTVKFTVFWDNLSFSPWNIYFYEDANYPDDEYTTKADNINIEAWLNYPDTSYTHGSGSYTFYHTYTVADTYAPYVVLGNSTCSEPLRGSCSGSGSDYSSLIVNSPPIFSSTYNVQLDFAKYNDVKVNYPVYYEYLIDPDLCTGSTITGRRLFKGYPAGSPQQIADTGAVLSVNTGDGYVSWSKTPQPYSDYVFPYVHVYCNNGSYAKIYAGGAINLNGVKQGSPKGISVYTGTEQRFNIPSTWLGGGRSDNFTASGTYLFQVEKHTYSVGEQVKIKYQFYPTSEFGTIDEVRFQPDEDTLNYYFTSVSTDELGIEAEKPHYFSYEYSAAGEYKPSIKIISASGSTIQLWLHDPPTQIKKEGEWLSVTAEPFTSGAFTGSGYGIFGLSPSTFHISFGKNPNEALSLVESSINYVMQGVLYLASITFDVLMQAPFYSTVVETIHPPAGSSYILPNSVFGITLPDFVDNKSFTISYASGASYNGIYQLIVALVAISFIVFSVKRFL